jgi:hypothetical protein
MNGPYSSTFPTRAVLPLWSSSADREREQAEQRVEESTTGSNDSDGKVAAIMRHRELKMAFAMRLRSGPLSHERRVGHDESPAKGIARRGSLAPLGLGGKKEGEGPSE